MKPFNLSVRRGDGYGVNINDLEGKLVVTVTRESDGVSWRGSPGGIDAAVLMAGKIVEDQELIRQMKEGDRR